MAEEAAQLLERIWEREAGQAEKPNFLRIMRDSQNNLRDALMTLETELPRSLDVAAGRPDCGRSEDAPSASENGVAA